MKVNNLQQRSFQTTLRDLGALIDTLASKNDRLWPRELWPTMRFDKPIQVGANGGHGPIRYFVKTYNPGHCIYFEFTGPSGFHGFHGFSISNNEKGVPVLRHMIEMETSGFAIITWPLIFKPLHEALMQDLFEKVEKELELERQRMSWNIWVRFLRWSLAKKQ